MAHRTAMILVFALSCGGTSEPAKSPPPAETPVKAETAREPTAAAPAKHDPPATPAAATAAAGPASTEDVRGILQAVIDDDALAPYLKLQLPGRFPLRVSGRVLPKDLQLVKATKPVVVVDEPARDPKKPVLIVTELEVKGDEASVSYRYDVENVRGFATLNKQYGRWNLKQSRVAEH